MATPRGLATACGAVVAAVVVLLTSRPGDLPADRTGPATLPDRMAAYSHFTATVSSSPPGRAVALYQHGWGVEFLDFPHAEVLGADGDVYRRVDEADKRADGLSQGDPGPMLLSPDGERVAVGDYNGIDVALVDLATGDVTHHRLPSGASVLPMAWSPDGSQIVYLADDTKINPYRGTPITGRLGLLDVRTGTARALPGTDDALTAAFSPDGTELAVQRQGETGTIDVLSLTGGASRAIDARGQLAGAAAWSPDGTTLATVSSTRPTVLRFTPASGEEGDVAGPVELAASAGMLGWRSPTEVLVIADDEHTDSYWVTAVPTGGGEPQRLMEIPDTDSYGVGRFELAPELVRGIEARPAGEPNRGPLAWSWRIAAGVGAGLATTLVVAVALRRSRRRAAPTEDTAARDAVPA